MPKKVIIIGSGFAGLSAACFLARDGYKVTVIEKNATPGGRARKLETEGFTFDMGPSWYWMPDVFERFFAQFGKKVSDYYSLVRLDPSYRVYWPDGPVDIPAKYSQLQEYFESLEPGSADALDKFLAEAAYKYEVGIKKLVFKPGHSITEFLDTALVKGLFKLDVFTSMRKHVSRFFTHPKLKELLEFPVLFLGALPQDTPALYSLMNFADIKGGTWFPMGGMYKIVEAMYLLARELGVKFVFNEAVTKIAVSNGEASRVISSSNEYICDMVVAAADYHHVEANLLEEQHRSYTGSYWDKRVLAPSCLLYFVGLNKKLDNMRHHSLFFDVPFAKHAEEIYETKEWPTDPLFYVSTTSVTDASLAPEGCENLFFLIPVAAGLSNDDETRREGYFNMILTRFEQQTGQSVKNAIIYRRSYAHSDFVTDYNSFKGNAYGLANTLLQTAILKPSMRSKKVKNLFYAGQLTVPGPGVPPSLISGEVAAGEVKRYFNLKGRAKSTETINV